MTEFADISTADGIVAIQIIERLLKDGLVLQPDANRLREKLVDGTARAEDWRLLAEKALELQMRKRGANEQQTAY